MRRKIREIEFCVDNRILQTQYNFLYILYIHSNYKKLGNRVIEDIKYLQDVLAKYKAWIEANRIISGDELDRLVEDGYVEKLNHEGKLSSYNLTDKFLSQFIDYRMAANELWEAYPGFHKADDSGKLFPLKSADKDEIGFLYWERIEGELTEHNEVMKDIVYGVAQGLIKQKISSFVKGEVWGDIRKLRKTKGRAANAKISSKTDNNL